MTRVHSAKRINNFDQQVEAAQQRLAALLQSLDRDSAVTKELLAEVLTELAVNLAELQVAGEQMRQQGDELLAGRQAVETESRRYQELFDFAPDGYVVTDARGVIREANRAAAQLLQIGPEFLSGKPLAVFVVNEDRRTFRDRLTRLGSLARSELAGQSWEVCLKPRRGRPFATVLTVAPQYNDQGRLVSLRWLLRDVSQQKRVEEALRASEMFSRAILNSLEAHIAVINNEGAIIAVNEGWESFARQNGDPDLNHTGLGINYLEICRRAQGEFSTTAREALAGIRAVLDGAHSHFTLEYFCPAPTRRYWFVMYITPLVNERGGAVISHVNITERKQVEEEMIHLFEQVHRQREQLRALAQRLAEVQEAERKQLASELHDQVGQKLTALDLNLNIIQARLDGPAGETSFIQARLDDSLALVEQTATSIRDVMASLRPPMLDDYGLAATLRWYAAQVAERVGLTLAIEDEAGTARLAPPVENALFRIVQEALTNVAKHAQASAVSIKLEQENGLVRMIVADNGRGFKMVSPAETNGRPSWGLATMAERAEAVGGSCRVESKPDRGTQVIVEILLTDTPVI